MITRSHLDEAHEWQERLYREATYEHAIFGNSPQFQRLLDLAERATLRYERRLEQYQPLRNVACLLWHGAVGPLVYALGYRWRKR